MTTASEVGVSGTFDDLSAASIKVNGKPVATSGTNFNTTVQLNTGANNISIIATDAFNNSKEITRTVTRQSGPNQTPSVNAGNDLAVTLPASASLNGTITDDGLPTCAGVTGSWTKVSGPGAVTFANASAATTTASFSAAGSYVLRLTGSDSELSASDDVIVTVVSQNQRPVVNAAPDQTITLSNSANLNGSVSDDGLPAGSSLTVTWSKVSGPGSVTFANPNSAVTTASFSAAGVYLLRLTASDSQLETSDDIAITVNAANQAPVVNAGANQTITPPNSASLSGSATDDGLPAGSSLTVTWSKVSGPGSVTFANPSAAATSASFSTSGTYVLRLTASDSELSGQSATTVTVNPAPPTNQAPVASFAVPREMKPVPSTVEAVSNQDGINFSAAQLLDNVPSTYWRISTGQVSNQFVKFKFNGSTEQIIDRVRLQAQQAITFAPTVKDFEVQVSQTGNDPDFVTVLSATYQNNGQLQDFIFPGGAVRARYARLIARNNYGDSSTLTLGTFHIIAVGSPESIVSLIGNPNAARNESPAMLTNGAAVVAFSSQIDSNRSPNGMLQHNGNTWRTNGTQNQFAIIELAGSRIYTLRGVKIKPLNEFVPDPIGVKDFEVWVSTTTADDAAFTRVLADATALDRVVQTFLFPGGPAAARYIKYVPLSDHSPQSDQIATELFDVIAEGVGGVVGLSSPPSISATEPELALDNDNFTQWIIPNPANQWVKIRLSGGVQSKLYGVRIQPGVGGAPKDFDIRVSTTTDDDSAFSTVFSGTLANDGSSQQFLFNGLVDALYVQFYWKNGYSTSSAGVVKMEALAAPLDAAALATFSSQGGFANEAASRAFDIDISSGTWVSTAGQPSNQSVKLVLPGADLTTIDQVVLQPGWVDFSPPNTSVAARDFDLMVSTTDLADSSFTTVLSGTLNNVQQPQSFLFPTIQARFLKLVLKNNYGSTSKIALQFFHAYSPDSGSTEARFIDSSSDSDGAITSYSWNFGDGGTSSQRDPLHAYAQPGTYTVTLTVTDNSGSQSSRQLIYHAYPVLKADFSFSPLSPREGVDQVRFIDQSSERLGSDVTRSWSLGTGTTETLRDFIFSYQDNGVYQVSLTAGDPNGVRYTAARSVPVSNLAPNVSIPPGLTLVWGQQWSSTPTITDPGGGDGASLRCSWDFGDGQSTSINNCNNSTGTITHAYAAPGTYTATITVLDKDSASASASAVYTVNKRPTAITGFQSQSSAGSQSLQATLMDAFSNQPLGGKTVSFELNGVTATAVTDSNGVARATLAYTAGEEFSVASAQFEGDELYLPITGGKIIAGQPVVRTWTADSRGTDFWVVLPANAGQSGFDTFKLLIASETANSGTVTIPGLGLSTTFTVEANSHTAVPIPRTAMIESSDMVENKGIHVTSQNPVSVYPMDTPTFSHEAYLALPARALGRDYMALGYKNTGEINGARFILAATTDQTTVTITPTITTGSHLAGVPYSITLNQGQVYQLINSGAAPADLTGTVISADKPIAVFGGHTGANVPEQEAFANMLVEQLPPVDTWGREFAWISSATRPQKGDVFRFLASADNTRVYLNGTFMATLDRGEYHQQLISGPLHVFADKPILVAQYSTSSHFENVVGDPFMALVPPVTHFSNNFIVASVPRIGFTNYINVVAPASSVGSITLDGAAIPQTSFVPISNSGYSGARLTVSQSNHNLAGPAPFAAIAYGFNGADAYGYPAGMQVKSQVTPIQLAVSPKTATVSVGTQDCVVARVTDLNNNPVAGAVVSFAVSGANAATGSVQTDQNGEARFCYTGANIGSDLITASISGATDTAIKTWVPAGANQAPVVSAGGDQVITLPATAMLNGSASDDGLPAGSVLAVTWSKLNGPGTVTFANPNQAVTTAGFSQPGLYVVQLSATDSALTSTSTATITVNAAPVNQAPVVSAGSSQTIKLGANLLINSSNDQPLVNGEITGWSRVTGSGWTQAAAGTGSFPAPFEGATYFYAGETGSAELRQDVDVSAFASTIAAGTQQFAFKGYVRSAVESPADSSRIIIEYRNAANSDVLLTLDSGEITTDYWASVSDTRTAPASTAWIRVRLIATRNSGVTNDAFFDGLSLRAVTGAAVRLSGSASDDGLPNNTLTTAWSKVSGPGTVSFESTATPATTAVFSAEGTYVLRLTASDSALAAQSDLTITVEKVNIPPVVNAGENQSVQLPGSATLNGSVTDDGLPQGSSLTITWSKLSGPGDVTFANPSQVSTTAAFSAPGTYLLRLAASDGEFTSDGEVTVTVSPAAPVNQAPSVNVGPDESITLPADSLTLSGQVTDDGLPSGSLTLLWSKTSGPGTVTFSTPQAISTPARFGASGSYVIRLTVSDGELSSSDELTVTVNPEPVINQAPVVNAGADQTITLPAAATLNGTATDDGLPAGSTLAVTWSKVSGPGNVTFANSAAASTTATFTVGGSYVLRLTATDSVLTTSDDVTIAVIDPANAPPVVDITSPADGGDVTSPADVTGSVDKGAWRLEYSLNSEDGTVATQTWTEIASGTAPASGLLGRFDPTLLLNGIYSIRLSSTDAASGQTLSDTISVVVSKSLKIGNFTLAFNDLSVPVAGLPIQIIRSYDSRDKREGDFGVGWTLGIKNVRLEKSAPLGRFWQETQSGALIPQFCLEPTRPHLVTITFPDNRVYKFQAVTSPQCQAIDAIRFATLTFTQLPSDPGLQGATLTALGGSDIAVDGTVPGIVNFVDANNLSLYNPTVFELRTVEGFVFVIDQGLGVTRMTDPNGNTLTINANGITHSSGKSVVFTRDTEGRITRITDPNGNAMLYSYDANGDLISFKDRENNETRFSYDNRHGLLTITDPRGLQPIRNDYDADGRLIKHTDAFGKEIVYTHDLGNRIERITDRLGHETVYEYDLNGNVVRTIDPLGNLTQYSYDARDNKATETNALGKTTSFTYDSADNLLTQTDPLGNVTRFTYNERREVLTVTDPRGAVTTNTYDARGNLLTTRDALGNTTTNTYDIKGLLRTTTDALNNVTRFDYDFADNLFKQTDALGHETTFSYDTNDNRISQTTTRTIAGGATETLVTSFEYDKLNRLTKTTQPDGSTTRVEYNAIGQQSATIDQLGRRTGFEYDEIGRLTKTTYPDGASESPIYDAEGRRLASTDRAGRVTSFSYDEVGRLITTTYADSTTTSTSYDGIGRVRTTTDARGNSTRYEYDDANRRTKVIDAQNNETRFTYDSNGNQASMTDARGNTTSFEYDALNRRTRIVYADSTADVTAYDALGRVVSKTDQAGKQTRYGFDALGRLTSVTDALNQITRYSYDELGNQLIQTDANNHTTSFEYDKLGRRTRRTLPIGQTETYIYNSAGNLTSRIDFNGKTTTFSYDLLNRLLSKTPDPSFASLGAVFTAPITFTYTVTGRRASMTDPSGTTTYSYDNRDRLITKATPQGTLNYSYDATGNLKSMRSSNENGVSVSYNHDLLNRLASVTDEAPVNPSATNPRPATGTTTYSYDAAGNLAGYVYPSGVATSYNYNSLNRLTSMSIAKAATPLASFTYTLAAAGNRLSVTELSGRSVNYGYDDLYRLTAETITNDPSASVNGRIDYVYDPVGNRLSRTSALAAIPSNTQSYDANDRLTTDGYDANGNTVASGSNSYAFDFENRIIALNPGTPNAVTFAYDGDGNRVATTVGGVTTKFLVDDLNPTAYAQVVEEIVGGNFQRIYTHGHSLIGQTQLISGNWTASFYGMDGHGSVRLLTDSNGARTDTFTFDAFGSLIASTGSAPNSYLYTGEQFDADVGLYYLRARYMNPSSGRLWSSDSYEGNKVDPLTLHKYAYVHQNAINLTDPSGNLSSQESLIRVGLVLTLATISTAALTANGVLSYIRGGERDLKPRVPTVAELENPIVNYNAVEITGSSVTADEFFDQFVRTFVGVNQGSDRIAAVSGAPVDNVGEILTFRLANSFYSIGQQPFDVRIQRYDPSERTISAVTLGGHPLRGWRYWRVIQLGDPHHFAVETGAVDVANRDIDAFLGKASLSKVLPLWERYMREAVRFTNGMGSDYLIPGSQQGIAGSPGGQAYILDAVRP